MSVSLTLQGRETIMPIMNSSSIASGRSENSGPGLPRISYYPPIVATLLAAIFIFAIVATLCVVTALNAFTQLGRVSQHEPDSSLASVGFCGIISLVLLAGAVYFFLAVIKGIRDLGARIYYTRGTVMERQAMSARRVKDWLLVDPAYSGPDMRQASILTDEQIAASADRSQIVQPRGIKGLPRIGGKSGKSADNRGFGAGAGPASTSKPSAYLSPERISASASVEKPIISSGGEARKPHVIFRTDFASHAKLGAGEEVIVAHSPYLQHLYYVARLTNGEWEVYRNRGLI